MRVKLSDITEYSKGVQINGDDLIENGEFIYLNGGINPSGRWDSTNVPGNTVTISEGGNSSGYVNYISEPFWCGAHCYYLYGGPKNSKYLYYALKSQQDRLFSIRSGACMPNIKKTDLGNFEFEFDSDENRQNEVVSVLTKVESVIVERKKELNLLDELIKARFVEMFGDVVLNTKNWENYTWDNVLTIKNGKNQKDVENPKGIYPICGSGGIMNYADDYITESNSVIIGRKGNINNPILMREKFWNVDTAFGLEPNTTVLNVDYLFMFCNFFDFEILNKAVTIPSLTKADLLKIIIPIPPIELQERFADFVAQVDKSKFAELNYAA